MITKPSDIITEEQLQKWLGLSDYQLEQIRGKLPKYSLTREFRLYNRLHIIEWLENLKNE